MPFFAETSWTVVLLYALLRGHITSVCVTIYLHRFQTHGALKLRPLIAHAKRFWLWFTTGTRTNEWVAVHTYHHITVETALDPHSPKQRGILAVLFGGVPLYWRAKSDRAMVAKYAPNTPSDWVERNLYSRLPWLGLLLLLAVDLTLFGWMGLVPWGIQMLWIPWWAAGVINGLGHFFGYRNFTTPDESRNIALLSHLPIGALFTAGEEHHNNHHAEQSAAKFSRRWWEFDIGWVYVRIFEIVGLAYDVHYPRRFPA